MKKALLVAALFGAYTAGAQNLELGIGGGFSTNTSPKGNLLYRSDQSLINYAATLKLMYTTASGWQIGVDAHLFELSGKSSTKYPGRLTDTVGGDDKKIVYAKYGSTYCLVGNRAFRFSEGKSYAYVGAAIGMASARNNPIEYAENETYNAPDGGQGMAIGGQLGLVANVSEKIGFNIDVAVRYIDLKYDAGAPIILPAEKLHYGMVVVPVTVGLRYYLKRTPFAQVPRYGGERPMGRAMY